MKIFSFFSGSGFLDLGFELSGFKIDFVNELSSSFIEAYEYSREKLGIPKPKYGYNNIDINEYLTTRADELKSNIAESRVNNELVGFIGGPPCPDFSIAGKQKGRNGDNGKLSLSYVQLIIEQQPDFFLFENVKGLWRTAKHRAYYEELKNLLSVNYDMTERLTNALEFGVPQDRDRILLFGVHKKFNKNIKDFQWTKYVRYPIDELKTLNWPTTEPFEKNSQTSCPNNIPEDLTVQYWFEKNDVDNHPNGSEHFRPRQGLAKMQMVDEGDDSKKSYKRIHRWRYSPTACYGNNEVHLHPYKERRLTVAEALSIQSLPKSFELPPHMSLTDKFKTIGNGVPFLLSEGIAKTIRDFLDDVE